MEVGSGVAAADVAAAAEVAAAVEDMLPGL